MMYRHLHPLMLLATIPGMSTAYAQIPGIPGGASGAMGLPDVSSIGAGNAAGVLGYCLKNKFLGGGDAGSVLGRLTGKPEVKSSKDYSAGESGNLLSGNGSSFSLSSAPKQVKSKLCGMVLKQARSFI